MRKGMTMEGKGKKYGREKCKKYGKRRKKC